MHTYIYMKNTIICTTTYIWMYVLNVHRFLSAHQRLSQTHKGMIDTTELCVRALHTQILNTAVIYRCEVVQFPIPADPAEQYPPWQVIVYHNLSLGLPRG